MEPKSKKVLSEVSGSPAKPFDIPREPNNLKNDLFGEMCILWLAIALIDAGPRRVRRALEKQVEAVVQAIETFGFRVPILVRHGASGERYEVVDGHIRLEAASRLGAEQLPRILVGDLSDVDLRRLALSLNKLQESGEWDNETLRIEFADLLQIGVDLEVTGFKVPEIDVILQDHSVGASDEDPLDDLDGLAADGLSQVTRPGDVWIAGHHRIFCGRAQDMGELAHGGVAREAAMLITDPPWNVKISGHVSTVNGRHAEFAEASGEMQPVEFVRFLVECLGPSIALLRSGGVAFIFMDWRHVSELNETLLQLGVEQINLAVWVKRAPGMGTLYRSQHELVFVLRKPGARHRNNVQLGRFGRNRSNVWEYGGATSGKTDEDDFTVHPTVKPVAMVRDAILDVTAPGDVVLDCFLGSGSTLIAAESSRRRCVGVEIEPRYVDLALRRWMDLTGQKVIHAETGETYEAVSARRAVKLLPAPDEEDPNV
ncbi:DNA methylase N-4 [Silicimonas algicola]|uniref:Methyltransferase n=1 Tax=Silicimonas algicola TaxID=1826607 RepID=A0A316G208_9RHOB|nr:DNA modification methylase [Silicimonas algicola]AZQ65903.1 DNA methylase N-4 [Silicimonas algicola]PWK54712.1 DNA modification methylase [Silicimonas algicola]